MGLQGPRLKAGRVVRIRVNPRDCIACVDVAQQVGLLVKGMSFAQVVSMALSALCETARSAKLVPERSGFEYAEIMEPFGDQPSLDRARKLDITRTVGLAGSDFRVPPVQGDFSDPAPPASPAVQRILRRVHELEAKRDADRLNWSPDEQASLDKLSLELAQAINDEQIREREDRCE